jgi:hypothetical protein
MVLVALLYTLAGVGVSAMSSKHDIDGIEHEARGASSDIIKKVHAYRSVWTTPPGRTPANHSVDGPLMGNGDMGVCLGGSGEALRFYLSKNDFWRLKSQAGKTSSKVFGYLDIVTDALKGGSYQVQQSICDGVTTGTFEKDNVTVQLKSWVAATENILVVELALNGGKADVEIKLSAAAGGDSDSQDGQDDNVFWAVRKFENDVDIETEAAAAMKIIGAGDSTFTLTPDSKITLAISMTSRFKHDDPLKHVKSAAAKIDMRTIDQLRKEHQQWWVQYWNQSWVDIDDPVLEKSYYQSLYTMAAASRDPKFPPGIFGTWVTTNKPYWYGDYHLNYNHMAPFYALYSANRIEQADPQDTPILQFQEKGRWYATNVTKTRGVLYPVGVGPLAVDTNFGGSYGSSKNVEKGGMFHQQRSNAAYCLVNIAQRWRSTYDIDYAKKVYSFVKDVAQFWEDYLKFEDGRYVIYGDAIHEGSGDNMNPILSLGLIYNTFDLAMEMSAELDVDKESHEKWAHILNHLSGFTTQQKNDKRVFRYTEKGTDWWRNNTLGIQHIYPGNAIGLDSDPELLKLSHNTIDVMQRWLDGNGSNSFFPAAVRVGYDPQVILSQLRRYSDHTYPNGFQARNRHGIENCSTVVNTINMMLCMSHVPVGNAHIQDFKQEKQTQRPENIIRLFPVWPKERDARFEKIRCWGAFLVSSELQNGQVQYVKLYSEQGRDCSIVNPWPGKKVVVYRNGKKYLTFDGERFTFKTRKDETLILGPVDIPLEELKPRISG